MGDSTSKQPRLQGALSAEDVDRHAEMVANRIKKNRKKLRKSYERQNIGAYRLYDRDIPEIRLVADWYEGHVVLGEYERTQTAEVPHYLSTCADAVAGALNIPREHVHEKKRRTRPSDGTRYERIARTGERIAVREHHLKFWVNLDDYIDTGLFSDHRITRKLVAEHCEGRRFLNLFAYTGAFTCYAAAAGARRTTTVDLSQAYLRWGKDNLELNGLMARHHRFVKRDVRTFLDESFDARKRWDRIVVDPPSYSTRGGPEKAFDVLRDHRWLIERTLRCLQPGGQLWFSTNHQKFVPRLAGLGGRDGPLVQNVTERTAETVPADFRNRRAHRVFVLDC